MPAADDQDAGGMRTAGDEADVIFIGMETADKGGGAGSLLRGQVKIGFHKQDYWYSNDTCCSRSLQIGDREVGGRY